MSASNESRQEYIELFHAFEDDPLPVQSVAGRSGVLKQSFSTDKWEGLKGLDDRSIDHLIYASFGYCLSKFTDNAVSAFCVYDSGLRPVLLDCSYTDTREFLSNASRRFDEHIVARSNRITDRLLKQVVEIFDRLVTETIEKKQ